VTGIVVWQDLTGVCLDFHGAILHSEIRRGSDEPEPFMSFATDLSSDTAVPPPLRIGMPVCPIMTLQTVCRISQRRTA